MKNVFQEIYDLPLMLLGYAHNKDSISIFPRFCMLHHLDSLSVQDSDEE